ncbi:MAG: hypothetical protein M1294_12875 [Firmicutes bacterium]|jgi:hypothetical protein|nr:hypothetical protein [Bacillota bacterium]MCL5013602.1 hypothetical protein [Bacillota bacterium]
MMTWIIVLLAVDGAFLLAIFALLARIEQRLTRLERKKARGGKRRASNKDSTKSLNL